MRDSSSAGKMISEPLQSLEPIAFSHSLPPRYRSSCETRDLREQVCMDRETSSDGGGVPPFSAWESPISNPSTHELPPKARRMDNLRSGNSIEVSRRNLSHFQDIIQSDHNIAAQSLHVAASWPPGLHQTGNLLGNNMHPTYEFRGGYYDRREMYSEREERPPSISTGISMVNGLGNLGGAHDANRMEQLLVHCATAVESNDATLAQQIMWVLNNIVSTEGDPNQRVTAYFLRALISRAARMAPNLATDMHTAPTCSSKVLSAIELAGFVDLTPWHRFGFSAANGAILEALGGMSRVHIVDFSITHCMQWPTLIEALSNRPEGPPQVRLTVHGARPQVPPLLNLTFEELGLKLGYFARSKHVPFQFRVLPQEVEQLQPETFELNADEALVVNCQMRLHYIPDETMDPACPRSQFLRLVRSLDPTIVTLVDEDANLTCPGLVERLRAAFNYMWIPFDAVDTFLARDSKQRSQYEGDIGSKIENIIACEGHQRVERLESKEKWVQQVRNAHLQIIPFSQGVIAEVKAMLVEHAAGWGLKKEEDALLLTWKGHNVVFATACIPASTT